MNTSIRKRHLSLVLLLPLLGACASDKTVIAQASNEHTQLEPAVMEDAELKTYLQQIGDRIIASAKELDAQHYGPKSHFKENADWMFANDMEFHFVNSDTLNAFTTGGTHMYVYLKLLETCRTEDELAAVMAHEYGHVYARHVQQGMNRQYYSMGGALLAGAGGYALGGKEHGAEYAALSATGAYAGLQFLDLGYTREDEAEADDLGFVFYTHAGWDPKHFGDFFQQLIDMGLDTKSDTTSDHPTLKSRVEAANKRVAQLPPEATSWRKPPIADAAKFDAIKSRAAQVAKTMPSDKSLENAKTLLAAVSSCVTPVDQPDQVAARQRIIKAAEDQKKAESAPKP